jgi:hypothetical protein
LKKLDGKILKILFQLIFDLFFPIGLHIIREQEGGE